MNARQALADALASELGVDLTPEFVRGVDVVLIRLWLHGYTLCPVPDEVPRGVE